MISSISKDRLKYLCKLSQKKYRHEQREVIVEGFNIIEQLKQNGIQPLEYYFRTGTNPLSLNNIVDKCELSHNDMMRICDTRNPQDIAGLFKIPEFSESEYCYSLYLDGISDPGNLGTIFRSAAAFGVEQIVLSEDCCDVYTPKVIRSSLGSVFWLPNMIIDESWLSCQDSEIISTDVNDGIPLYDFAPDYKRKLILVIGSESKGVSTKILQLSDKKIWIEMTGKMESINASVATGILLSWLFKHRFR